MSDQLPTLTPLEGGFSGETFLTSYAGERAVVRIYGGRSRARGPQAAEIDAAVLGLVRGLLPVPTVLEARRGGDGVPALLVTSQLPGERLDVVLPSLDDDGRRTVGEQLGTLIGRLGHLAQPRGGRFADPSLLIDDFPEGGALPEWVQAHLPALGLDDLQRQGLVRLADEAQDLLEEEERFCLVHSDFNPKNLLVDPLSLEVTGVVDWEFAHAGSPYADLGNLLRFEDEPVLVDAVLTSYAAFMPPLPDRLLERARAADLFALVDLAARSGENPVADHALVLLRDLIDVAGGRS